MTPEISKSSVRISRLSASVGVSQQTLNRWFRDGKQPQKSKQEEYNKAMSLLKSKPRLQKHPSYGYYSPEQIQQLQDMKLGPDRDRLLKQIQKQQESKGKQ